MPRPLILIVLIAFGYLSTTLQGGDLFHHGMKARRHCGIPNYAYSQRNLTNPVSAPSFAQTRLTTASGTLAGPAEPQVAGGREYKTYLMNQEELRSDHCSLTNVAWTIDSDGNWILSFDASQDPMSVSEEERAKFVRFIQNRLYVNVRGYGAYTVAVSGATSDLAQPQLVSVGVDEFWLRRGERRRMFFKGHLPELKSKYPLINRIEIDLQYE